MTGTKDSKRLLLTGILSILIIVSFIGFYIYKNTRTATNSLNESDIDIISSFIKFSDKPILSDKYQSTNFNFAVDIDTKNYNYYETASGISFYNKALTIQG